MAIDPNAVGATTEPMLFEWTDRDTLLYALGVGAGCNELAFTTENTHGVEQQVIPTYAVVVCADPGALRSLPGVDYGALVHAGQAFKLRRPLTPSGRLSVSSELSAIHDKGAGRHAVIEITVRGRDCGSGELAVEAKSTVLIRGAGGFGGQPGPSQPSVSMPEREPDVVQLADTSDDQALIYRLSGDRNPLHSDPWFATTRAGFNRPILHGLCTFGFAGRALAHGLCAGDARRLTAMSARFSAPVYPGESLLTEAWITAPGSAAFRTVTVNDKERRDVITAGTAQYLP